MLQRKLQKIVQNPKFCHDIVQTNLYKSFSFNNLSNSFRYVELFDYYFLIGLIKWSKFDETRQLL